MTNNNISTASHSMRLLTVEGLNEQLDKQNKFDLKILDCLDSDHNSIKDLYNKYFDLVFKLQIFVFINIIVLTGIIAYLFCKK